MAEYSLTHFVVNMIVVVWCLRAIASHSSCFKQTRTKNEYLQSHFLTSGKKDFSVQHRNANKAKQQYELKHQWQEMMLR